MHSLSEIILYYLQRKKQTQQLQPDHRTLPKCLRFCRMSPYAECLKIPHPTSVPDHAKAHVA